MSGECASPAMDWPPVQVGWASKCLLITEEQQLRVTLKVFQENRIKPDSLLLRDPLHSPEGLWVTDVAGQRLHQRVFDICGERADQRFKDSWKNKHCSRKTALLRVCSSAPCCLLPGRSLTHDQLHLSNDTLLSAGSHFPILYPSSFLLLIFSLLIKNGSEARLSHYIHPVSSAVLQQDFIINRSRLAVWTRPLEAGFPRTAFYLR